MADPNGTKLRPVWDGSRPLIFRFVLSESGRARVRGRVRLGNDCEERATSQRAPHFLEVSSLSIQESFSFFNRNRPRTRPRPRVPWLSGKARICVKLAHLTSIASTRRSADRTLPQGLKNIPNPSYLSDIHGCPQN